MINFRDKNDICVVNAFDSVRVAPYLMDEFTHFITNQVPLGAEEMSMLAVRPRGFEGPHHKSSILYLNICNILVDQSVIYGLKR